jgi:hypothetical protein
MTRPEAVDAFLAYSDERDLELRLRLAAWRDGWRACQQHLGDTYEDGYTDAQLDVKKIHHGVVHDLRQHLTTWDGLRENFSQPRPGDYQGGPVQPW